MLRSQLALRNLHIFHRHLAHRLVAVAISARQNYHLGRVPPFQCQNKAKKVSIFESFQNRQSVPESGQRLSGLEIGSDTLIIVNISKISFPLGFLNGNGPR